MSANPYPFTNIHMLIPGYNAVVPGWLLKRLDISPGAKLCYGYLLKLANNDQICAGNHQDEIAKALGCTTRNVRNYLTQLEKAKLIGVIQHGLHLPNSYRLTSVILGAEATI